MITNWKKVAKDRKQNSGPEWPVNGIKKTILSMFNN